MSSFKKRIISKQINGTKTSLHNGLLITSSGNLSLDHILGGGLPIGSILLIEEDRFVTYSKVLSKYFLAEGIYSNQSVFHASLDDNSSEFLKKLPKPVDNPQFLDDRKIPGSIQNENDDMRIAWRYNELPVVNSEQLATVSVIGHHFNLTEQIDEETLNKADFHIWDYLQTDDKLDSSPLFYNAKYEHLLKKISQLTNLEKFSNKDNDKEKGLLRICLTSVGSPVWYDENFIKDFLKFLTLLRFMVKSASAVCFLSIPLNLLRVLDDDLPAKIRTIVDYSFELESFAGSDKETHPAFKEYHGIFHIRRLCAVNSLASYNPETSDLAFKMRRKRFTIEKLHLPPELGESTDPQQPSIDIIPTAGCGSGGGKKNLLDF